MSEHDDQEERETNELLKFFGNARIRFWVCPVREHGSRKDTVTVTWEGHVASCTSLGCQMTSEITRELQKASYDAGYDRGIKEGRTQGIKHNREAIEGFLAASGIVHPPLPSVSV